MSIDQAVLESYRSGEQLVKVGELGSSMASTGICGCKFIAQ